MFMRESIFPCLFPPYTVSTLNLMVLHKISIPPSLYSPPGGPPPSSSVFNKISFKFRLLGKPLRFRFILKEGGNGWGGCGSCGGPGL